MAASEVDLLSPAFVVTAESDEAGARVGMRGAHGRHRGDPSSLAERGTEVVVGGIGDPAVVELGAPGPQLGVRAGWSRAAGVGRPLPGGPGRAAPEHRPRCLHGVRVGTKGPATSVLVVPADYEDRVSGTVLRVTSRLTSSDRLDERSSAWEPSRQIHDPSKLRRLMSIRDTVSIPAIDAAVAEESQAAAMPGDLNDQLVQSDVWTDEMVAEAGIPVIDAPW